MGLFDVFKKKLSTNDEYKKWDDFCTLDESYKDDAKSKPIYYLKLYGKNEINSNSKIRERAKRDFIRAILDSLKNDNEPIIKCLVDYLINRQEILDNEKLIDIIANLDKESLDIIANSHTFYSYIQTREKIKNINNNEIKQIVEPLENALSNSKNQYNVFISKYSKEFKEYLYNIYNIMMDSVTTNKRFENYEFNNNKSNIYFYENGIVVAFNEDEKNIIFVFNKFKLLENMQKIKRLLFINSELFAKNYIQLILEDELPRHLENEFYTRKPYYICKHEKYGNIEFYYNENGIELRCDALDSGIFQEIQIPTSDYDGDEKKILYVHTIEKIIEKKEEILERIYNYALNKCIEWEEKDEDRNQISMEYIKNNFKIFVTIWSEIIKDSNGNSKEEIEFVFSGNADYLLGDHNIDAMVKEDNIDCAFQ